MRPSLFFFNDTATTEIYTLSLHDALPISMIGLARDIPAFRKTVDAVIKGDPEAILLVEFRRVLFRSDRKSTRLNSSHLVISYAVFCLKKKKNAQVHHCRGLVRHVCTMTIV